MNTNSNLEFRKIKSLDYLYEINENGTILRNVKSKKQVRIFLNFLDMYSAVVTIKGIDEFVFVQDLVAECWLGDEPEGCFIEYIDRNRHNNHYTNLRYVCHHKTTKPVTLIDERDGGSYDFDSYYEASKFLESQYDTTFERMRAKFKDHRKHIYDFDVFYHPIKTFLNAETIHGDSTE